MSQEIVNLMQNKRNITNNCDVQEKISVPEIKDNKIYNLQVSTNIIKQNILNNSISYECELFVSMLYESNITNRMEVKEQKIDFTHTVSSEFISKNSSINTVIEIESKDYVCMPDSSIDLKISMNFIVETYVKNPINIVSNIKIEKEISNAKRASLVIYYVKSGDTLWKIAKRFKSTVDEIAKINNLENPDKINIGEQLYIPRYVYNQVSQ